MDMILSNRIPITIEVTNCRKR